MSSRWDTWQIIVDLLRRDSKRDIEHIGIYSLQRSRKISIGSPDLQCSFFGSSLTRAASTCRCVEHYIGIHCRDIVSPKLEERIEQGRSTFRNCQSCQATRKGNITYGRSR